VIYPSPNFVVVAVPFTLGITTGVGDFSSAHPPLAAPTKKDASTMGRITGRVSMSTSPTVATRDTSIKHGIFGLAPPRTTISAALEPASLEFLGEGKGISMLAD
jgi:hypothetical protein